HDAPWRQAFGGSIYYSGGSHGCVNMPVGAAATVFGQIEEGYPIVVYY
ncbi:MAG: L,D-transpeptidase, partial [Firmicutes bacterium]|nr:L,D-transpeptidase [Bacillota bacterium]